MVDQVSLEAEDQSVPKAKTVLKVLMVLLVDAVHKVYPVRSNQFKAPKVQKDNGDQWAFVVNEVREVSKAHQADQVFKANPLLTVPPVHQVPVDKKVPKVQLVSLVDQENQVLTDFQLQKAKPVHQV